MAGAMSSARLTSSGTSSIPTAPAAARTSSISSHRRRIAGVGQHPQPAKAGDDVPQDAETLAAQIAWSGLDKAREHTIAPRPRQTRPPARC